MLKKKKRKALTTYMYGNQSKKLVNETRFAGSGRVLLELVQRQHWESFCSDISSRKCVLGN
jgi:hypothetical protein